MAEVELRPHGMAAGGDAVAREASGRVVFVRGALPDEQVVVRVVEEKKDFARAVVARVVEPSPDRVEPPCPFVALGCGGCGWQHIAPPAQRVLKRRVVQDALARVGRLPGADVADGPVLAAWGFRTTLRMAVDGDGRPGFRRARGHDTVAVGPCAVAHPLLDPLVRHGRFPGASEVVLRCSAATGERVVLVEPDGPALRVPDGVAIGASASLTEVVHGAPLRVSARSFFQARPDGAAVLVDLVRAAAAEHLDTELVVDAYAGVGLFAACLPRTGRVVALEASRDSCADAEVNLAGAGAGADVIRVDVARWRPQPAGLVVADPPRTGLGRAAASRLAATGAARIVLVSCDPVAMARDAALLVGLGYAHRGSTVVDLFPHTPHVEVVTTFDRS
jgi:23S rRNA (uracil1939-C5)-methyltransferase